MLLKLCPSIHFLKVTKKLQPKLNVCSSSSATQKLQHKFATQNGPKVEIKKY
jgi:hypothetical protein